MKDADKTLCSTPRGSGFQVLNRLLSVFYVAAALTVAVDQLTKFLARGYLPAETSVRLIPGFFDLKLSFNTGAAFGILPDWAPLFIICALAAIFAIVKIHVMGAASSPLRIGLGLLLGGAVGNLIDRVAWPERGVTDFLSFYVRIGMRTYTWPTFNLADAAIVVGAALVVYHVYVIQKRELPVGN